MPDDNPTPPTMQDLSEPTSLISRAFMRLRPPSGPFDPNAAWSHTYADISSHHFAAIQGTVSVAHEPGGKLHVESYRRCPNDYRYYTIADLQCSNDELSTPTAWEVESKIAKAAHAPAYLNTGLHKRCRVENGSLTLHEGQSRRRVELAGRHTCKWCLLAAAQRLPGFGTTQVQFTLIDEYDALCPGQVIRFRGTAEARTRAGVITVAMYQHTGVSTVPGVFYVGPNGRLLCYLAGMQLLALTHVGGKKAGFR